MSLYLGIEKCFNTHTIYKHINISDDKHFKAFKAFVQASSQRLTVSIVNLSVLVTLETKGSVK